METFTIQLDQFLKLRRIVASGGEAKHLTQTGAVLVNGAVELRRGRQLHLGDQVRVAGQELLVEATTTPTPT